MRTLLALLLALSASAAFGAPEAPPLPVAPLLPDLVVRMLEHKDPKVRESALTIIAANPTRDPAVVKMIVWRYDDPQEPPAVVAAARLALKAVSGIDFKSPREARGWWQEKGQKEFVLQQPLLARLEQGELALRALEEQHRKLSGRLAAEETLFRLMFFVNLVVDIFFIVIIIAFAVMGGSRLKAMRETTRQAERYVEAAEDVHKRFDTLINDIEAKKTEILDYFRKLKEEHENEIERYTELLEQNTEHRVREEAMGLRRKGELELEETMRQLKGAVNDEIRKLVDDQKAAVAGQAQAQEKRFRQEAEAHTLFLEAALLAQRGKPEDAVRAYRRVLALESRHALAWIHLAAALRGLGRTDEAHEAAQKALEIAPDNAQALYGLAAAFALQRNRDRMLEILARAFQGSADLRDEALNDAAFRDYWQDPGFKNLAEA
jgi:tetratricopeptide (TPR) repeat protein